MTAFQTPAAVEIEAARTLLARLGITPEQLLGVGAKPSSLPTLGEYIDRVSQAVTDGTRRAYDSYWKRIREAWGERRLDEPTPLEIKQLAERIKAHVVIRRNTRGGRSAAEHTIAALRCLYSHAVADGLISEGDNPATRVAKPHRLASTRRALPDDQLVKIIESAGLTGNDPELDALLLRLHTETACRRGGALALRRCDLDAEQCLIRLREKGETVRWQPVSLRFPPGSGHRVSRTVVLLEGCPSCLLESAGRTRLSTKSRLLIESLTLIVRSPRSPESWGSTRGC